MHLSTLIKYFGPKPYIYQYPNTNVMYIGLSVVHELDLKCDSS